MNGRSHPILLALLILGGGRADATADDETYDVMNPPAPCADQLRGYTGAFADREGDLRLFQWIDVHHEDLARPIFQRFYRAPWKDVGSYVAGDLRLLMRPGEPIVGYYGDRRLSFFDQEGLVREDHGPTTILRPRGTEDRYVLNFSYDGRRRLEVWLERGDERPVRVLTATSGRETYRRH